MIRMGALAIAGAILMLSVSGCISSTDPTLIADDVATFVADFGRQVLAALLL